MALQVRRHGCLADGAHEGAGGGEPAAQEDVRRIANERRHSSRGNSKKIVRPSQRREMARWAVEAKGVVNLLHIGLLGQKVIADLCSECGDRYSFGVFHRPYVSWMEARDRTTAGATAGRDHA